MQSDPKVITAMSNTVYCIISGRPPPAVHLHRAQLADEEDEAGPHIVPAWYAMNSRSCARGWG